MERAPLNALQIFVVAARVQNLTRAAERLHLTVSALSHQVRLLEQRLGCTLFVRGPRGLKPTAEGALLLQRVGPHLDAIDAALRPLCARRDTALSLTALPSMASSWLVPRLPRFFARHPEFEFNLDSSIELVDFADGRFDGALRYGPGRWGELETELLFEEWLTPVVSPQLLKGRKRPRLTQLGDWPLLCPDDPWQRWFEQFGGSEPARYVATFSDSETLQRAAVEGMGVALGRLTMARPLLETGRLVALFPERMKARYAHYLVYPKRSLDHAGFKAFRTWLLAESAEFRGEEGAGRDSAGRKRAMRGAPSRRSPA
ncbi:LysR substrate-binding domain-containing protein [Dokdonella sp.]|uniref:LysR substrate-binding domain-containing protein n=1 Tax=Dokdonella sp. TaxID=2291710 RepID=UPI001B006A8D|nr:LysR substrate-binding domain-containing protein [Dokdonella sp.]MBO9662029.1 LysR family transcriptional regulator [Dokdonella sp.]